MTLVRKLLAALTLGAAGVAGCTGSGAASATTHPAPTPCPHGIMRAAVVEASELTKVTDGHYPRWLPKAFGLSAVYDNGSATWSDARCREVSVGVYGDGAAPSTGPSVGPWRVIADAASQCGNQVLGSGRCLDYQAKFGKHVVTVQMMGVERDEGDRIVRSIG